MPALNTMPEWLGAALIGAVIAALGYVSKLLIEAWAGWRNARAARLARLLKMSSLLHASYTAYRIQREHVGRLKKMLLSKRPDYKADRPGFERLFSELLTQFTPEEKELHGIIRSITEHTLRPLNQEMSEWLRNDLDFRTARRSRKERGARNTIKSIGQSLTSLACQVCRMDSR